MKTSLIAIALLIGELLVMLTAVEKMQINWESLQLTTKIVALVFAHIGLILIGLNCWIGLKSEVIVLTK